MDDFTLVGARPQAPLPAQEKAPWYKGKPVAAYLVLGLIVLGCLLWGAFSKTDAGYMDLSACNLAPSRSHLFGTDTMGRDIFAMIWSAGGFLLSSASARRFSQRSSPSFSEASAAARTKNWEDF